MVHVNVDKHITPGTLLRWDVSRLGSTKYELEILLYRDGHYFAIGADCNIEKYVDPSAWVYWQK